MMKYVNGLLFSPDCTQVALIQKNKPAWQAGKWNGVGGKLEDNETWAQCMSREFEEETGVHIPEGDWEHTVTLFNDEFECRFFRAFSDKIFETRTVETEHVSLWDLDRLQDCPMIENLAWLIPFQLDMRIQIPVSIREI